MNPHVKQQLVAALRSGAYSQITGTLRQPEGHCVNGVLCQLHSNEHGLTWEYHTGSIWKYSYCGSQSFPAQVVLRWAGLTMDEALTLERMNDREVTFKDLADYVEKYL